MEKRANSLVRNASLLSKDYIPFLGGRPERELPINSKDIMDLKIDLWTTASVDEFMNQTL
ncbi:MAG: hypothetical protein V1913_09625 [Fibrobacterota bacterium]